MPAGAMLTTGSSTTGLVCFGVDIFCSPLTMGETSPKPYTRQITVVNPKIIPSQMLLDRPRRLRIIATSSASPQPTTPPSKPDSARSTNLPLNTDKSARIENAAISKVMIRAQGTLGEDVPFTPE